MNIKIVNNPSEKENNLSPEKKNYENISNKKIGRNEPCPCGSGKKYKHCCGAL